MSKELTQLLAAGYMSHRRSHGMEFDGIATEIAQHVQAGDVSQLDLVVAIAELCTDDTELYNYGSHYLREYLANASDDVIQDLDHCISTSESFKRLLQMIPFTEGTRQRAWIEAVLTNHSLVYGMLPSKQYALYATHPNSKAREAFWWVLEAWTQGVNMELKVLHLFVEACEDDSQLAIVAAGPLEYLLYHEGPAIEGQLDELARMSPKWRQALCGVWLPKGTPAGAMLDRLLKKYGLAYGSL